MFFFKLLLLYVISLGGARRVSAFPAHNGASL